MNYSLENYAENVVEKHFGDRKVKVIGPLSKVYAELLNEAFVKTENLRKENKENMGLEALHHDNTSANLPGDMIPKIVSEIVATPKSTQTVLFVKDPNQITEEDIYVMGKEANVKGKNFFFVIDETKNMNDPNAKEDPKSIQALEQLVDVVLNNHGRVFKLSFF